MQTASKHVSRHRPDGNITSDIAYEVPASEIEYDEIQDNHDEDTVEEQLTDARRFEDFETIDWIQDTLFERSRRLREDRANRRRASSARRTSSYLSSSSRFHIPAQLRVWSLTILHATQSWIVVTLVGAGIGVNAALVNVVTSWLTDLKFGYCRVSWWLNSKFCCWEIDPIAGEDGTLSQSCQDWRNWSEIFFGLGYLVYVGYAVTFALSAAYLVRQYAPYAAGSGISEIKCILAGFIMKGFLGPLTLIIKSITLVRLGSPYETLILPDMRYLCHYLQPLAIASGLSVGKEGPSVHVACAIGSVVGSSFPRFSRSHGRSLKKHC